MKCFLQLGNIAKITRDCHSNSIMGIEMQKLQEVEAKTDNSFLSDHMNPFNYVSY